MFLKEYPIVSPYVHDENSNPKSSRKEKYYCCQNYLEVCFDKISVDPVLPNIKREQSSIFFSTTVTPPTTTTTTTTHYFHTI
jgi:hypothetical protein